MAHTLLKKSSLFLVGASLMGAALPAMADITDFTVLDDPANAKSPFVGNAEAGYTGNSGNSSSSNLNAAFTSTWYNNPSSYSLWANATNSKSSGSRTGERYGLGGRSRYNLDKLNYLFGQASWESNRFSGYRDRYILDGGYGRQIWTGPNNTLSVEVGPGFRHDVYTHGAGSKNRVILYGAATYTHRFSKSATFSEKLATEVAAGNTTTSSVSALNVAINSRFTLALSYSLENNTHPYGGATHKTDTTTAVSIIYGF